MAEVDDWTPVAPKKAADDDWAPVGGAPQPVAITPGEKQFDEDKRLVEQAAGFAPGELKAATYSGLNAFLLNAPSHVVSAYTALKEGKPYEETFKEQKRYEQALERQYPKSSMAGTAAGIGAGLLVPMGAVGQAGRALQAGTAARLAETAAPQIVKSAAPALARAVPGALTAGAMTGTATALEKPVTDIDVNDALKSAAIGAGIGATAELAIPALSRYFSKFPDPLDAAGNLKPEAMDAVKKAFPQMEPEAIASFQDELAKTFRSKGATPEAAKEALLAKEGVTPTRSSVTGERPKAAAADIAEKAALQGEQKLAGRAAELAGETPESGLAEALHGKERAMTGKYKDIRGGVSEAPGTFKPEAFDLFLPSIEKRMMQEKIPTSFENTSLFPKAAEARKFIEEGIAAGNLPNPNMPFNMDNVELVRRNLLQFSKEAKNPTDRRAIGIMIDGFDDALNKALVPKLFSGDGRQIISDMERSRDLWSNIKNKFYDNKGKDGAEFKKVMNALVDRQTGVLGKDLTQESANTANLLINGSLLNPKTGLSMYSRLETALGKDAPEMKAVKDQIRNMVLNTNGDLNKLPTSIDTFLAKNKLLAEKVFDEAERADMRRLSESIKLVSGSKLPNEQKESRILNAIQRLGSMIGAIAMWNIHGSPLAGAATYVAGEAGRAGMEAAKGAYQRGVERAASGPTALGKAPEAMRIFEKPLEPTVPVRNLEPALSPDQEEYQYQAPVPLPPLRAGRKAGGRVGSLSDKLVIAVDRAKKEINNDTKVLLNADDSHVAKALEVANRHIEG